MCRNSFGPKPQAGAQYGSKVISYQCSVLIYPTLVEDTHVRDVSSIWGHQFWRRLANKIVVSALQRLQLMLLAEHSTRSPATACLLCCSLSGAATAAAARSGRSRAGGAAWCPG